MSDWLAAPSPIHVHNNSAPRDYAKPATNYSVSTYNGISLLGPPLIEISSKEADLIPLLLFYIRELSCTVGGKITVLRYRLVLYWWQLTVTEAKTNDPPSHYQAAFQSARARLLRPRFHVNTDGNRHLSTPRGEGNANEQGNRDTSFEKLQNHPTPKTRPELKLLALNSTGTLSPSCGSQPRQSRVIY